MVRQVVTATLLTVVLLAAYAPRSDADCLSRNCSGCSRGYSCFGNDPRYCRCYPDALTVDFGAFVVGPLETVVVGPIDPGCCVGCDPQQCHTCSRAIDVIVEAQFEDIGSLVMSLTNGQITRRLIDKPGLPDGQPGHGCLAALSFDEWVRLTDEGVQPVECGTTCDQCFPNGQVLAGPYVPNESLSEFLNRPLSQWTMTVRNESPTYSLNVQSIVIATLCEAATPVDPTSWGLLKTTYEE